MKEFILIALAFNAVILAFRFLRERKAVKEASLFGTLVPAEDEDGQTTEEILGRTGYLVALDPWSLNM